MDEALHDYITTLPDIPHLNIWTAIQTVAGFLNSGADPNYICPHIHTTTIEEAASSFLAKELMPLFLAEQKTNFNARPGRDNYAPLARLMSSLSFDAAEHLAPFIIARMTDPPSAKSRLLQRAIYTRRWQTAELLISAANGAYLAEEGLLWTCCLFRCDENAERIAKRLIDAGYRQTGWFCYMTEPDRPHDNHGKVTAGTVLEMAIGHRAYYIIDLIEPFAEVSCKALRLLIYTGFAFTAIKLLDRIDIRRQLPHDTECTALSQEESHLDPVTKMISMFVAGGPVIPTITALSDQAIFKCQRGPYLLNIHARKAQCELTRYTPVLRPYLIAVFLRQGAEPHECIRVFPELCDALLPWEPKFTHLYYSRDFRQRALLYMIAMYMSPTCQMPHEMMLLVIEMGGRTIC